MIRLDTTAFAKGTPSIFVINSPLQVLLVVEAIEEFHIEDYKIVYFTKKNEIRNEQTITMLKHYNLNFCQKNLCFSLKLCSFFKLLFVSRNAYKRLFIPGGLGGVIYCLGVNYLQKKGHIIYIDDGIASISVLKEMKPAINHRMYYLPKKMLKLICKYRGIELEKYYYTIYSDIITRKIVYPNNFTYLKRNISINSSQDGIYFLGPLIDDVCKKNGIPLDIFKKCLGMLLDNARENCGGKKIYYIPHGRDASSFIVDFCKLHGVEYCHLNEAVELYFVRNSIHPLIVYGYVSTALLNIKMLMPDVKVINWYLACKNSVLYENRHNISLYYASRGIEYLFFDVDNLK